MPEAKPGTVPALRFPEFRDAGPWEVMRLGDLGPVSMCKRVMKAQTAPTGDVPFYKIGTFGNEADAYISRDLYEGFKSKYSFPKKGDILISAAGTIGRTVVYDGEPAYFQDSNIVWIANDEELATNNFLNFAYQKVNWRTDDNTIARLYNENLRSIKVALPSLPEQQEIGDCLGSLDDLIRAEEGRLEALRAHKTGLMQHLFPAPGQTTPRLRFPEFQNAGPWEVKRLGEGIELVSGQHLGPEQYSDESQSVPYFTGPSDFTNEEREISKWVCDGVNAQVAASGDVLVTVKGSGVGELWLLDIPKVAMGRQLMAVRGINFVSDFVFYFLDQKQAHLAALASGNMIPGLSRDDLLSLPIPVPPKPEEQQKIADCLTALDDLIAANEARIEALETHKRGLMQQLFPQEVG
ncbi:restriction endonuclease subunit S [Leisingera aquaemixtae]|uniref:restriction endonuclease subunit S n=1 Tax=Leisingera aquaemixtae TaxID=1396826 RepID=UPI0021A52201|nr:restriction endonuclease subunit S [Leisingera aquaemixtae]UWQ36585.1 restriction endonuclease subunit S [Leisingera aquaemixtae]